VNDKSAVVAVGFSYSHDAGTTATIVKLTRTTLIIPLVIGFGVWMPWFEERPAGESASLAQRVYQAMPVFIILFVLASIAEYAQTDGSLRTKRTAPWPLGHGGRTCCCWAARPLARIHRRRYAPVAARTDHLGSCCRHQPVDSNVDALTMSYENFP
jgi:hypothetical protein